MTLTTKTALAKDKRTGLAPLQHRHFATIATIIREFPVHAGENITRHAIAERFAARLIETNPQFNRDRFMAACTNTDQ